MQTVIVQANWLVKGCCCCCCCYCCCCLLVADSSAPRRISLFPRSGLRRWIRVSAYRFHYGHLRRHSQIKPIITYPPSSTSSQTLSAASSPVWFAAGTILLANQFHPRKYIWPARVRLRGATDHPPFANLRNHFRPYQPENPARLSSFRVPPPRLKLRAISQTLSWFIKTYNVRWIFNSWEE